MLKKMKGIVLGAFGVVALTATQGLCALTTEQQAVTDAIDTMITDMSAWGWTAILAVASFVIGAKVFKKILSRSTS